MKWVTILGLTFQFLAFWFAAPELLGATTLKRFEVGLKKFILFLPMFTVILVVLTYGITSIGIGLFKTIKSQTEGVDESEIYNYYLGLGIGTVFYIVFLIFYKRIKNWLTIKLAEPLAKKLIEDNQTRSIALIIGAVLFTLGFVAQLVGLIFN